MKIEIGESLLYSWLRHAKGCQIVQTNWKPSIKSWELHNAESLQKMMENAAAFFESEYEAKVFKGNASLSQLLQQAEMDVLGINFEGEEQFFYAVDVAFHEAGLNYGSKEATVMRVLKKLIRSAFCMRGFFNLQNGQVIFASPKIHNAVINELELHIPIVQNLFQQAGFSYQIRIIANDDFNEKILQPVIASTGIIADTTELFMRSMQMYNMFASNQKLKSNVNGGIIPNIKNSAPLNSTLKKFPLGTIDIEKNGLKGLDEMKIGALVRNTLPKMLEEERISKEEVKLMQTAEYTKKTFDIQYPLLQNASVTGCVKPPRYWAFTVKAYGEEYFVCSEWFEVASNNDRPYYMKWLKNTLGRNQLEE